MGRMKQIATLNDQDARLEAREMGVALSLGRFDEETAYRNYRDIIKLYSACLPEDFVRWAYRCCNIWSVKGHHSYIHKMFEPGCDAFHEAPIAWVVRYARQMNQLAAIDAGVDSMLDAFAAGVPIEDILA